MTVTLEDLKRMCDYHNTPNEEEATCSECPLYHYDKTCMGVLIDDFDNSVRKIVEWTLDHPER